ncbi:methylenetetrahydrofolate reductase [Microbacterium sp. NPDC091313]
MSAVVAECPKAMTWGPCGGVHPDGRCEAAAHPCVFLSRALPVAWPVERALPRSPDPDPTPAAREVRGILERRPLVLTAFPAPALDRDAVPRLADVLRGRVDAVLSGDAGRSRVQYPPAYRAHLLSAAGLRPWMGVNARDRTAAAIERELTSLRDIGVAGVHCVTGDHTRSGDRPDAAPVFDLESTSMIPLARERGLLVSFAESPASPPVALRGARVAEKVAAGGQLCVTQYAGGAAQMADFVARCRRAGSRVPIIAGVPLVVDRAGAELLASFSGAALPAGFVEGLLAARDVRAAGIRQAIAFGQELLGVPGVRGVVVAGGVGPGAEDAYADDLATVAAELGGGS